MEWEHWASEGEGLAAALTARMLPALPATQDPSASDSFLQLPDAWASTLALGNPWASLQTLDLSDNYFNGAAGLLKRTSGCGARQ